MEFTPQISIFETNADLQGEMGNNRRAFFIRWPSKSSVVEIQTELERMNDSMRSSLKLIHLNDEIYIVPQSLVNPSTLFSQSTTAAEIIELFGIRNVISVLQSVPIRNDRQIDTESLLPIATRRRNLHGVTMKAVGQVSCAHFPALYPFLFSIITKVKKVLFRSARPNL